MAGWIRGGDGSSMADTVERLRLLQELRRQETAFQAQRIGYTRVTGPGGEFYLVSTAPMRGLVTQRMGVALGGRYETAMWPVGEEELTQLVRYASREEAAEGHLQACAILAQCGRMLFDFAHRFDAGEQGGGGEDGC
jgi:hypothetical protein